LPAKVPWIQTKEFKNHFSLAKRPDYYFGVAKRCQMKAFPNAETSSHTSQFKKVIEEKMAGKLAILGTVKWVAMHL